jgi:hypothetical protein
VSYKRGLAIVFGCAIAGLVAFAATYPRFYSSASAVPAAAAPVGASAGEVLSPLSSLSSPSSPMAYKKMSPDAQKRLHERMAEWIHMTPDQRKVARENYQVSKSVPVEKRERAWDAYQKLPEDQKKKLAATERPRRPTVVSAPPSGKTEVKDIDRLMTAREHSRASEAAAMGASTSPAAPGAPAIPGAASFVPATPIPVSPQQAPSVFNGS